jgi:hypothetical protein
MVKLYNEGSSPAVISKQCDGLSASGVRYRLRQSGVKFRKRGPVPKKTSTGRATRIAVRKSVKGMIEDYHAGLNLRQIGDKYKVSHETVRINLKKQGVVLRDIHGRPTTTLTVAVPTDYVKMFTAMIGVFHARQL